MEEHWGLLGEPTDVQETLVAPRRMDEFEAKGFHEAPELMDTLLTDHSECSRKVLMAELPRYVRNVFFESVKVEQDLAPTGKWWARASGMALRLADVYGYKHDPGVLEVLWTAENLNELHTLLCGLATLPCRINNQVSKAELVFSVSTALKTLSTADFDDGEFCRLIMGLAEIDPVLQPAVIERLRVLTQPKSID